MTTQPAGQQQYTIQRAYIHDTAKVTHAVVRRGEVVVNIGELCIHASPEKARDIAAAFRVVQLVHDMQHENVRTVTT